MLGQQQVVTVAASAVCVAGHLNHGGLVFIKHFGHRIQHWIERRLHIGAVGGKGQVARHVEDDVLAITGNGNTGAFELLAQLGFLNVHVIAHATAGNRTDARPGQRTLFTFFGAVGSCNADQGPGYRADGCAGSCLRGLFFACVRVDRAAARNGNRTRQRK